MKKASSLKILKLMKVEKLDLFTVNFSEIISIVKYN
jgi:hypothetical protein